MTIPSKSSSKLQTSSVRRVFEWNWFGSKLLNDADQLKHMSLTAEDFERYLREDDDDESLGDALAELAVDVETDAVDAVREIREHR